ncbi:MAG: hypothetical protein ACO1TE_17900 [Prosthecobacter sp.]
MISETGFIARTPHERWVGWGSDLAGHTGEFFQSAYLSDNEDGLGLALIFKQPEAGGPPGLEMMGLLPVLAAGVPMEVELLQHEEDEELHAAGALSVLTARRRQLRVSDPDYLEHRDLLREGAHYRVELCGWVRSAEKQPESFDVTGGVTLEIERARRQQQEPGFNPAELTHLAFSMSEMRSLMDHAGEPGWYEFMTRVENLRETSLDGKQGWLFEGDVESADGDAPPLRLVFAMMKHVGLKGYMPAEGDLVAGHVFLQALVKQEVPCEGLAWADRPAESDFVWEDILAVLQTGDRFADTPPAVGLTARLLAQQGWEVSSPPFWEGTPELHPALLKVQRGEDQYLVGLAVNGDTAPECDVALPVDCTARGDKFELTIDPEHPTAKCLTLKSFQMWA